MTTLHAYFALRNQQAFQRLVDASARAQSTSSAALSSSGGKSWNRPSPLSAPAASSCDVNTRDWLGRTVLHLAVTSLDPAALEYVRLLLAHPRIDVNIQDTESRWSPLHRALYAGNLAACLLLLQRSDIDISIKDFEGYTAFQLYNSTVEGTKPDDYGDADLFTWGANRNAALGLGDGDDRSYPEQVVLRLREEHTALNEQTLTTRFSTVRVRAVAMSRLHTTVVTSENHGNVRACGFGSGGRLGPGQHTQYSFTPIPQLQQTIVAVALGQDHTLALTAAGDVLSWGLNRFSQLGYVVEPASSSPARALAAVEEQVQAVARRIYGPLRKEVVRGVAACKSASACWTREDVFTWGTNSGQLGYDKASQPVQIQPRRVSQLTHAVIGIALTDNAMACLLSTQDVICFWNDRHFKINFPAHSFPSEIQVYRPPMAVDNENIAKIVSCDNTFAALSSHGEVFTFTLGPPTTGADSSAGGRKEAAVKPQRVWALRKQFSAVKDVALGLDGSIILCTESGHVFFRSRNLKSGQGGGAKAFKFQHVPYIQRVVQVSANSTGSFAALRVDCAQKQIEIQGNSLAQDLRAIQPYMCHRPEADPGTPSEAVTLPFSEDGENDEDTYDLAIQRDVRILLGLCGLLADDKKCRKAGKRGIFDGVKFLHGADLFVQAGDGTEFPVHRVILLSRCPLLSSAFSGQSMKDGSVVIKPYAKRFAPMSTPTSHLVFAGCHPLSVLIFLVYLYSDQLVAVWDRRITLAVEQQLISSKVTPAQIKTEIQALARMLALPHLTSALEALVKRPPTASMAEDLQAFFDASQGGSSNTTADTILDLSDKPIFCHSPILRARSPFFASLFDDEDWTTKRWKPDHTVTVDLKHLNWRVMSFVLRHIYCDCGEEMFETLDFVSSVDDVLEFMFEVMATASELLLDRLSLICSAVILKYVNLHNACFVLADATYYHAMQLIETLQGYMACNLETLLESRMLDDLSPDLIKQLSTFIRAQQAQKLSVTRSNCLIDQALEAHAEWLELQDIPQPIVRSSGRGPFHHSPRLSPIGSGKMSRRQSTGPPSPSVHNSPATKPRTSAADAAHSGDEIFAMDEPDSIPSLSLEQPRLSSPFEPSSSSASLLTASRPWKYQPSQSSSRVDMKAIMIEAQNGKASMTSPGLSTSKTVGFDATESLTTSSKWTSKLSQRERRKILPSDIPESSPPACAPARVTSGSPWRVSNVPATPTAPITPTPSNSTPVEPPRNTPPSGLTWTRKGNVDDAASVPPRSSTQPASGPSYGSPSLKAQPSAPGMGPTFAPSRPSAPARGPSTPRRVSDSGSGAWTAPPTPLALPEPSPSQSPLSFLAIQQQQRDQGLNPRKNKQSLREIQEEEQARQAEVDFLKWWTAEEERMKLANQLEARPATASEGSSKKSRSKRKPPFKSSIAQSSQSRKEGEVPQGKQCRLGKVKDNESRGP